MFLPLSIFKKYYNSYTCPKAFVCYRPRTESVTVPTMQAPIAPVAKGTATRSLQSIYTYSSHVMSPEDYKKNKKIGPVNQHISPQQTTKSMLKGLISSFLC